MHFIDTINNTVDNLYNYGTVYYDELPKNTFVNIPISFLAVSLFERMSRGHAIFMPSFLAATATAIHAFVTPLFKRFYGNRDLRWTEEMCRTSITLIGQVCVATALSVNTAFSGITIIETLFIKIVIMGLINIYSGRRDIHEAQFFV